MKTYTKSEILKLRTHVWAATVKGVTTIVKSYLKENALIRFQKIDSELSIEDVYLLHSPQSCNPVDQVVEINIDQYIIQYDYSLV